MIHNKNIQIFDDTTMSIFMDGYYYNMNNGEVYDFDDKMDKTREIPEDELLKFHEVVNKVNSNIIVVYSTSSKYYFVAYNGIPDDEFEWTDEMEHLYKTVSAALVKNGIGFK